MVGLQLAVSKVPHFDDLIPTGGHNDWVAGRRRKANGGNPIGMVLNISVRQAKNELTCMVYLHWARVFHSLIDLSRDPETI